MNKKILLVSLLLAPMAVLAQQQPPNAQHHQKQRGTDIKEPKYELSKDKFNELKSVAITSIDRRMELLRKEKQCIQSAQERPDLKKCLQEAQEYRKKMMEDFKERREQIKNQ